MLMLSGRSAAALLVAALLHGALGCATFDPPSLPFAGESPRLGPFASAPQAGLLVVVDGSRVRLHDTATGEALAESELPPDDSLHGVALSPDGARIVVSTWQGRLISLARRGAALVVTAQLKTSSSFATPPVFRADGALAMMREGGVDVWLDGDLRRPPVSWKVASGVRGMGFRPTDGALAAAFDDHLVTWDVPSGRLRDSLLAPAARRVAYAVDGTLATGASALILVDAEGARETLEGATGCEQLAWDPGGRHVACVGSQESWVCTRGGCQVVAVEPGQAPFDTVAPAPDGFYFASKDGRILHRLASGVRRTLLVDGVLDRPRGVR